MTVQPGNQFKSRPSEGTVAVVFSEEGHANYWSGGIAHYSVMITGCWEAVNHPVKESGSNAGQHPRIRWDHRLITTAIPVPPMLPDCPCCHLVVTPVTTTPELPS